MTNIESDAACRNKALQAKEPSLLNGHECASNKSQNLQPITGNLRLHMSEKFLNGTKNPKQTNIMATIIDQNHATKHFQMMLFFKCMLQMYVYSRAGSFS